MTCHIKIPGPQTNYQHPGCFANGDRNCCRTISSEHFFSHAYLKQIESNNKTKVGGLSWQKPQIFSIIPTKGLASNILCARHNSALSSLDTEFGFFTNTIRDFDREPPISVTRRYSGRKLELCFLKCLVGLSISGN